MSVTPKSRLNMDHKESRAFWKEIDENQEAGVFGKCVCCGETKKLPPARHVCDECWEGDQ